MPGRLTVGQRTLNPFILVRIQAGQLIFMMTLINLTKQFISDFFHASFFAIIEYDIKLQNSKTFEQRALIWIVISLFASTLLLLLLFGFWNMLDRIQVGGF